MQKRKKSSGKKKEEAVDEYQAPPTYCICRSTDGERFMIACDKCEEWYHGDCINVTPKQAEQIKTFYCHQCRRKTPSLEIEYKSPRNQKSKQSRRPPITQNVYHENSSPSKSAKQKRSYPENSIQDNLINVDGCSPVYNNKDKKFSRADMKVSPTSLIDGFSGSVSSSSPAHKISWSRDQEQPKSDMNPSAQTVSSVKTKISSPRSRPCGVCAGCSRTDDCGRCDFCRDRRKFGGPNRMRQKCRLRQCSGPPGLGKNRNACSSNNLGYRRRKQQPIHDLPLEPPSPTAMEQYVDFDDEQFEVPMDFSPRPFHDCLPGSHINNYNTGQIAPIGSKMRRGDHRLPSSVHDFDGISSRSYQRYGLDGPLNPPVNSRVKEPVSGVFSMPNEGDLDFLEEDSDDDVVISGPPHCAGPTCIQHPVSGNKYCSETCQSKHTNSRYTVRSNMARAGVVGAPLTEVPIPYNLPYPDHMYCRHHRVYNWHGNGSTASYRGDSQYSLEQSYISDNLRHHQQQQQQRTHPAFRYSPGLMPHSRQLHANTHSVLINPNSRLGGVADTEAHPVLYEPDNVAFMDPMSRMMRRSVGASSVAHLVEELGLDLPNAPEHASVPSPSTMVAMSGGSVRSLHRPTPDPTEVLDDDGVMDVSNESQTAAHSMYNCYLMSYGNDVANGHGPRNSVRTRGAGAGGMDAQTHRILMSDSMDSTNGVNYSSIRTLNMVPTGVRHGNLIASSNADNCLNAADGPVGSVTAASGSSAYLPGPEEFYTINDTDDLEINWPQETVAAGVNG